MGDDWDADVHILPEFVCQAIPGPAIDPATGAWKKPESVPLPGQQAPAGDADGKRSKDGQEPPQKNAG
jgi:hypothetical protein